MIRSQRNIERTPAAGLLAALLFGSLFVGSSLHAADGNQLAWAPNRDDAVIVDGFPGSMLPQESALSKSLMSQRPRGLSRPAPMRPGTYLSDAPAAGELLPSVGGTFISPDGLPVLGETYYDETGGAMPADGMCCNQRCCQLNCSGMWGCGRVYVPVCLPRPPLNGLEFFGGVQGFTGPANRGGSGSFGFHEGFNWGVPIGGFMAGQWGVNWTQSNFDGNFLTNDTRNQIFVTGGLFRRVDWGFQGGLVVDYLHDGWDYNADLLQLRGELSWLWCDRNELGFWFTAGINDANNLVMRQPTFSGPGGGVSVASAPATLAVNDIYAFFFRRQFYSGGQGRLFGGFTGHGQGLVGGDAQLPITTKWSLRSSFIYVAPDDSNAATDPGFTRESWNVSISLVWTPCPRQIGAPNYCRPLFNVADNGTFITRLLRP